MCTAPSARTTTTTAHPRNRSEELGAAQQKALGFDTRKGMNADLGDYDNDGWLDVYVTNITDEYMKECNMLWHNNHDGTFTDLSRETGTCETLWGWAAKFGDYDNDGLLDLFVVNGLRSAGPDNYIPVVVDLITKPNVDFTDVRGWPDIGNMTWSALSFLTMWFQNTGLSNTQAALLFGTCIFCGGCGAVLGGWIGDTLTSKFSRWHARPLVWSLSVYLSFFYMYGVGF